MSYTTLDAGLLLEATPEITVGLMMKNIIDLSDSGYAQTGNTRIEKNRFSLPLVTTLGIAVRKEGWLFTCDQEYIYGRFGGLQDKTAEFLMLRAGLEKSVLDHMFLRAGVIVPVIARTSSLGNVRENLPSPKFGATLGIGAVFRHLSADLALTGDPGRSYMEQAVRLKLIGSISLIL